MLLGAVMVGLVGGAIGRRPLGLIALWVGVGVSYPIALEVGLFAFLGEFWEIYLVIGLGLAAVGYLIGSLATGLIQEGRKDQST